MIYYLFPELDQLCRAHDYFVVRCYQFFVPHNVVWSDWFDYWAEREAKS